MFKVIYTFFYVNIGINLKNCHKQNYRQSILSKPANIFFDYAEISSNESANTIWDAKI